MSDPHAAKSAKLDPNSARRIALVDAATRVFLRYGFKKTSMDDVARAAGVSRQGLYLHFETKELLFKEAVLRLVDAMRVAVRAALAREDRDVEERLADAFLALHGAAFGEGGSENGDELLEAATVIVGPVVQELDVTMVADVARVLKSSGVGARWKDAGVSVKELAENLLATSYGVKHRVSGANEYREKMRVAAHIICAKR
jgi:AcrR family transcriptional regulator